MPNINPLKTLLPKNLQAKSKKGHNSRHIIRSFKAKMNDNRTPAQHVADFLTDKSGSMLFLLGNVLWFSIWIIINTGFISSIPPFDPFPFGLLTMIVSLEAIILAIIVLISQNRGTEIDDLREEIDLQVNIITEQELTKLMEMMTLLLAKNGVDVSTDTTVQEMLKQVNVEKIEESLEKEIVE